MNRYRNLTQTLFHRFNIGLALAVLTLTLLVAKPLWSAWAAPGDLDPTFSGDGRKEDIPNSSPSTPSRMRTAIQADGKILVLNQHLFTGVLSNHDFVLRRLNQNGSFDTSFNEDGTVTTNFTLDDSAEDVAVQPDGKIIVAGYSATPTGGGSLIKLALARYNPNGSLDTTFDGDGKVLGLGNIMATNVALQPNGKIIVLGFLFLPNQANQLFLARFNTNGSLDTTFGVEDIPLDFHGYTFFSSSTTFSLYVPHAIQNDGKILVKERNNNCLRRYNANGLLDPAFGVSGSLCKESASGSQYKVQSDGKILVLKGGGIGRLNADGSDDFSFGSNGFALNSLATTNSAFAVQEDGRLITAGSYAAGTYKQGVVCRYLNNGAIDTSFGFQQGCKATTFPALPNSDVSYSDVILQADDRIVATGQHGKFTGTPSTYTPVMARYKNDNTDTQTTDVAIGVITAEPTFPYSPVSWTYTIPATNLSPTKAAHVTITTNVPYGTTFHSVTLPSGWAAMQTPSVGATTGTAVCAAYYLAPGATANLQMRIKIAAGTPSGQTISMTATVNNVINEPNLLNNIGSKTFSAP